MLTQCQDYAKFLQYLAQLHDFVNHVVFQYQGVGFDEQGLVCLI